MDLGRVGGGVKMLKIHFMNFVLMNSERIKMNGKWHMAMGYVNSGDY